MADDPAPANDNRKCPICGKPRLLAHQPFCSRRCADIDLFRWLKGGYVIPGAAAPVPGAQDEDDG